MLESLPGELLGQILLLLSTEPPSIENFNHRPCERLYGDAAASPLKSLSRCSRRLRAIAYPYLYKHSMIRHVRWEQFVSFCRKQGLEEDIRSLRILIEYSPVTEHCCHRLFSTILESLPCIATLVITCPPDQFHLLTNEPTHTVDSWTFNMPWQSLRLDMTEANRREVREISVPLPVFELLPWEALSVNEGSFLRAYTQYEYFLRQPPTILIATRESPGHHQLHSSFLEGLRHFNYTAIFPFYNHVSNVMNLIDTGMPNLLYLSVCLSPHPNEYDSINAQETLESSGKIDYHDAWMEFETSYEIIGYHVKQLGLQSRLKTFESIDWTFGGEVQKITESRIAGCMEFIDRPEIWHAEQGTVSQTLGESLESTCRRIWHHTGHGIWKSDDGDEGHPLHPKKGINS